MSECMNERRTVVWYRDLSLLIDACKKFCTEATFHELCHNIEFQCSILELLQQLKALKTRKTEAYSRPRDEHEPKTILDNFEFTSEHLRLIIKAYRGNSILT